MKKIGPILSVPDDFVTNMQTAYESDNERGSHQLNNEAAERLNREWPTVVEMARRIEMERDDLKEEVERQKQVSDELYKEWSVLKTMIENLVKLHETRQDSDSR